MEDFILTEEIVFEQQFWLQIMGDHARFIYYSLAPDEEDAIKMARNFMEIYDDLLEKSRQQLSINELNTLTANIYDVTYEFRAFKLKLLSLSLTEEFHIHLPPTFFNHMLNELDEFLSTLSNLTEGKNPVKPPLHYHLHWLLDAAGHAAGVTANLDEVEKDYIKDSMWYEKEFLDLFHKALEFKGYLRTGLDCFPAMERLNEQAENIMMPFMDMLEEIRNLRLSGRLLGTLMPLMADHMAREECYYLMKLSESANTKMPECDPARPRI